MPPKAFKAQIGHFGSMDQTPLTTNLYSCVPDGTRRAALKCPLSGLYFSGFAAGFQLLNVPATNTWLPGSANSSNRIFLPVSAGNRFIRHIPFCCVL